MFGTSTFNEITPFPSAISVCPSFEIIRSRTSNARSSFSWSFSRSLLNAIFREGVIFIKASSEICEKNGIRVNSASICSWSSCISAGYPWNIAAFPSRNIWVAVLLSTLISSLVKCESFKNVLVSEKIRFHNASSNAISPDALSAELLHSIPSRLMNSPIAPVWITSWADQSSARSREYGFIPLS